VSQLDLGEWLWSNMASSWMVSRFRTAWLSQNLDLLVLRLLRESAMSEWQVLSRLHAMYGLEPSAREFARLEKRLVRDGFMVLETSDGDEKLRITPFGLDLLRRVEDEYRKVVGDLVRLPGSR
jgi:hypothetical protein